MTATEKEPELILPEPLTRLKAPIFAPVKQGALVSVRRASETETKLGLYLGDMPIGYGTYLRDGNLVVERGPANPAIYVFADKQIIYGVECWWGEYEEGAEITDEDIANSPVALMIKAMSADQGDEAPKTLDDLFSALAAEIDASKETQAHEEPVAEGYGHEAT